MRGWIDITGDLQKRFVEYCHQRRAERGKTIQSVTAIRELLSKALSGIDPPKPIDDRLTVIEARLTKLEESR